MDIEDEDFLFEDTEEERDIYLNFGTVSYEQFKMRMLFIVIIWVIILFISGIFGYLWVGVVIVLPNIGLLGYFLWIGRIKARD